MKIRAISHIKHDGEMIEPGKTADVPDKVGKYLIKSGSAEAVKQDSPAAPTGDERESRILEAMSQLKTEGKPDNFTKDGRPGVEVIEEVLGFNITAKERDALWEKMNG